MFHSNPKLMTFCLAYVQKYLYALAKKGRKGDAVYFEQICTMLDLTWSINSLDAVTDSRTASQHGSHTKTGICCHEVIMFLWIQSMDPYHSLTSAGKQGCQSKRPPQQQQWLLDLGLNFCFLSLLPAVPHGFLLSPAPTYHPPQPPRTKLEAPVPLLLSGSPRHQQVCVALCSQTRGFPSTSRSHFSSALCLQPELSRRCTHFQLSHIHALPRPTSQLVSILPRGPTWGHHQGAHLGAGAWAALGWRWWDSPGCPPQGQPLPPDPQGAAISFHGPQLKQVYSDSSVPMMNCFPKPYMSSCSKEFIEAEVNP